MSGDLSQAERDAIAVQVRRAREQIPASIDDAAASVSMSPVTWGRVEKARPVRSLTYAGIERALGWSPGATEAVAARGIMPTSERPIPSGEPAPTVRAVVRTETAALIQEIYESTLPNSTKLELVRNIQRAEAARAAEIATARGELDRRRDTA